MDPNQGGMPFPSPAADEVLPSADLSEHPWESLNGTLTTVALGAVALGYLSLVGVMSVNYRAPRYDLMAGPIILALGGTLSFLPSRPYRPRAWTFLATAFLAAWVVNRVSLEAPAPILYAFVCVLAGILLGPLATTAFAGLGTAALLAHAGAAPSVETAWYLGTLWLSVGVMWAGMGNIVAAIARSESSEARAWHYARQANARRGELAGAKKALTDLYDLLQRTNRELAIAREEAEEAREIKAQFAANISHELRTPLNLIVGFSEMMYRSPEAYGSTRWSPALRADVYEIYQASLHLSGMIDDILDLSRIQSQRLPLRLEPTDLAEVIEPMVVTARGLLRGKEVDLRVYLEPELPPVVVDRMRIGQVLLNLLNNAIRFTDQGHIEVSAGVCEGEVVVSVADTGVGIPPEDMTTIFEEFGQARTGITGGRGGAGLGLAICKQFVHLHGGRIEAESQVGQGSTFRFRLPLPESGRARSRLSYYAPEGWSPPVPENPLGSTVLVLGPASEAAASLARAIQGYRAIPVDDLSRLPERVEAEHPDGLVLVSDPTQPEPFDPAAILRACRRPDLPLIRCRIPTEDLETVVSRELGVAGYLVKPIQREHLLATVKAAVARPRRILAVDDDPGFVSLLRRMLETEFPGLQLRAAYSGEEALAALAEERPDLALIDLIMPGGNGTQVVESMRREARLAGVPVIVTTGSSFAESITSTRPGQVSVVRDGGSSREVWGRYVSALLRALPPDYSRPALPAEPPAVAAATPAS